MPFDHRRTRVRKAEAAAASVEHHESSEEIDAPPPLHRAAAFASEDTIQLLLDAGAKVDAKDMNGDSPLTWASWFQRPDSILRKLCYGGISIDPERRTMDAYLLGQPYA